MRTQCEGADLHKAATAKLASAGLVLTNAAEYIVPAAPVLRIAGGIFEVFAAFGAAKADRLEQGCRAQKDAEIARLKAELAAARNGDVGTSDGSDRPSVTPGSGIRCSEMLGREPINRIPIALFF